MSVLKSRRERLLTLVLGAVIVAMLIVRPIVVDVLPAMTHDISVEVYSDFTLDLNLHEVRGGGYIFDFGYRVTAPGWDEIELAIRRGSGGGRDSEGMVDGDYVVSRSYTNWFRLVVQIFTSAGVYIFILHSWREMLPQDG